MDELTTAAARQVRYERSLCACLNMAPDYVRQGCGWVKAEDFTDPTCRAYWQAVMEHGNPDRAALDLNIYVEIQTWKARVERFSDADEFARKIVGQRWLMQVVGPKITPLAQCVQSGDFLEAWRILQEGNQQPPTVNAEIPHIDQTHAKFVASLRNPKRVMRTGTKLDSIMGGFERQTMTVLGGWSGTGKSALALQLARNVAQYQPNEQVAFFSMEMSEIGLWERAALGEARLRPADKKAGRLSRSEMDLAEQWSDELRKRYQNLHIYETGQTTDSIWQNVALLRPSLVIIDHLRLMLDSGGENETIRLGRMSWAMKRMAKDLNCSVLLLAQLKRENLPRNVRPQLSDIRQSGEIAENADIVLMTYRDLELKVADGVVDSEVWFRKHRDGENDVCCTFQYDLLAQKFTDR